MSGASKRSHEESGHSSSKYGHDDIPLPSYPRLMSAVSNEYQSPHDVSQDNRMGKTPRMEHRDTERRSPMHSVYRMPSTLDDSHSDHPVSLEGRLEPRDLKDNRDFRTENREPKVQIRDLYAEAKRDTQSAKTDKDGKFESRGEETKKMKYDGESHTDLKGDSKVEKDGYGAGSSYLNWKESKEYHRGKRYSEPPSGSIDPWHIARHNSHESAKDDTVMEDRGYGEAHEAVGDNKVDSKTDDKLKDKDRKRKDVKLRDWGEKDKERNDNRRSNMPISGSTGEGKDIAREEKEAERWDKERKDPVKDKEGLKEREKDHPRRETWAGTGKDGLHPEKDSADTSSRLTEQETPASELKKRKDHDGWKNAEKEGKDKKKERETNLEGEKIEKPTKETDEGCADGEVAEREREVFNYDGIQQRKRMLRPRGSPQTTSREPRFRSHMQENEGGVIEKGPKSRFSRLRTQGKDEVSSVVYKVGESMQDLIKLWKEYESSQADKTGESFHSGPTLEIRIPAEYITATNRQVRGGQLWGTDIYTYDSDLVAVLMHTGYCRPTASPPPSAIQELRATIQVLPPLECYFSTLRNNVRSRAWGAAIGCSYRVNRCCIVKRGGGTIDLEPCITHTSTVEPTLAPVAVERTMTTRAAASNALRQQRFVREVTIQYNLCNEPWIKYSLSIVADKGLKKQLFTSARLKKGEALYLETHSCRYELCFTGEKMVKAQLSQMHEAEAEAEKSQNHNSYSSMNGERNDNDNVVVDVFRWSRCKKPLPQKTMRSIGIPLPLEYLEVLEENIEWEDVEWSQTGVWIAGKEYSLARVHFLSPN